MSSSSSYEIAKLYANEVPTEMIVKSDQAVPSYKLTPFTIVLGSAAILFAAYLMLKHFEQQRIQKDAKSA